MQRKNFSKIKNCLLTCIYIYDIIHYRKTANAAEKTPGNAGGKQEDIIMEIKKIMLNAHNTTRATVAGQPGISYRATFALALRAAWIDARQQERNAAEEWQALSGEQQAAWLIRQTWSSYNKRDARQRPDGSEAPNLFAWVDPRRIRDELQTVADDAWIIATEDVERMPEKPLALIIAGAVSKAAYNINHHERKHANALRQTEDGEQIIDITADPRAERIAPAPEYALLAKEYLAELTDGDALNAAILAAAMQGYRQQEIAAALHVAQQTVSYRLAKMRERYHGK